MQDEPLVSIILATYNRVEWLPKSIGSVLQQTYQNWELIVWDDGSSDATELFVRSINDQRIRYFYHDNRGKSYALNHGILNCKGNYFAFLDDDDQWEEHKLSHQVSILETHPEIELLFSDFQNINLSTNQIGTGFAQCTRGLIKLKVDHIEAGLYQIRCGMPEGMLASNFIASTSVITRRSVLERVGKFNEGLRNSEDFEYWFRASLQGIAFAYVESILITRVKPPNSLSSPGISTYENVVKSLDSCKDYAIKYNREDLAKILSQSYRSAWLGMIRQYAILGERKLALQAFGKSLGYGISLRAVYLLLGALAGPKFITLVRRRM